jgi:NADPH:quinone reductase-like Zn-dependent oxidoreductase
MKAIFRDEYGSPDVLQLRDIDKPEIGDDEVLLRVHAAGVGRDVWHVMAGLPYPIRLAGYGLRGPKNPVIGSDVAGELRATILSRFVDQKLGTFVARQNRKDLILLKKLIESGKLKPVIDRTYPLAEAPEAIRYLAEGQAQGKGVVTV